MRLVVKVGVLVFIGCTSDGDRSGELPGPTFGSWSPMANANTFVASAEDDAADWNGKELFVWEAFGGRGWLYNRASDSWRGATEVDGPSSRQKATVVWANNKVLLWGESGCTTSTDKKSCAPGVMYDAVSDSWATISTQGAPNPAVGHHAVWTGEEMVVWGGQSGGLTGPFTRAGGVYLPATDSWRPMSAQGAPSERVWASAVWTGASVLIWGGAPTTTASADEGARYDPKTDQWTPISKTNAPASRWKHAAAWTGTEMFVWGGDGCGSTCNDGAAYNPTTDSWRTISGPQGLGRRIDSLAVWDGASVLLWGGVANGDDAFATGARWNPVSNSWQTMAANGAPPGRGAAFSFWTGSQLLIFGGDTGLDISLGDGAFYSP